MLKFADHTNIFYSDLDIRVLLNTMNKALQNVILCLQLINNKLSLNTNKTHFILFSTRENSLACKVNIPNIEFDRLYYTKFLGVIIDKKLYWKEHIGFIGKNI